MLLNPGFARSVVALIGPQVGQTGGRGPEPCPTGVDVLFELRGQFRYWGYSRSAVEIANHPNAALVYNCEQADIVGGSVASTYDRIHKWVRHVPYASVQRPSPGRLPLS